MYNLAGDVIKRHENPLLVLLNVDRFELIDTMIFFTIVRGFVVEN